MSYPSINPSWVSPERFEEYLQAAHMNKELADALYVWNARASAALFELIHHFEVLLRNTIVRVLETVPPQKNGIPGTPWIQQSAQVFDVVRRLKTRQ
ncbi:hypothetical protein FYJ24_07800 [Actinomycetaceae bacterium WB03_NA08]|uniref:Uncharacterized protein n=1 Tax=Scrofimicrobium canadense TaxID=2652290 RepID=A0A6N7VUL5_9ACTO|nr:hypothetical protein [Scrofimicrobium canadense]MSS84670.1 hypothetical protein [Scrofimicrobium canadense]